MRRAILFACMMVWTVFSFAEEVEEKRVKVGLLVMATGKYDALGMRMIESARKYFLPKHERTFFFFTDGTVPEAKDIVRVEQKRLGWPYDTLKRFHVYLAHKELFKDLDYIYAVDADMLFMAEVGDEILGDLVATKHWGYLDKRRCYSGNRKSTAYVTQKERKQYCCGAFYGGRREEVLKLLETNVWNVDIDLKNKVIPKWHDESHLNRYFIDHTPTVYLSSSYCFPMGWDLPYEPKLVAIDKAPGIRK